MIRPTAKERQDHSKQYEFTERERPQTSELPEKETIARAQQGDASAFEHLYQLHRARVYALCLRMTNNTAEAEDIVQETFLMVFRKIQTFRGDSAFSTWLHRIAVNLALMRLRRKTSRESPLEQGRELDSGRLGHLQEFAVDDHFLAATVDRLHLERAMQKLRPFHKLVVVLHDIQGYKHTEIAKMLDWSIGNSKACLHRARARLRDLLRESFGLRRATSARTTEAVFTT
jgi:RNA polymerase sigma-70 factor, ECF subfamily